MKFTYLDPVEVISGFYKGFEGYVYQYDEINCAYYVVMAYKKENTVTTPKDWIHHRSLRKLNEK